MFTGAQEVFPLGINTQAVHLAFGGSGANNATITGVHVYAMTPCYEYASATPGANPALIDYELNDLGIFVPTLASGPAGIGGATSATATRMADTLTFTESAAYTAIQTAYGIADVQTYNPADDANVAFAIIPTLGWCTGLVFDWDLGTATSGFVLITRK